MVLMSAVLGKNTDCVCLLLPVINLGDPAVTSSAVRDLRNPCNLIKV